MTRDDLCTLPQPLKVDPPLCPHHHRTPSLGVCPRGMKEEESLLPLQWLKQSLLLTPLLLSQHSPSHLLQLRGAWHPHPRRATREM